MVALVTALFLLEPSLAVKSAPVQEDRCYAMRILPVPKDFKDPIALQAGPPQAKLEEVRPNCWAQPSTDYVLRQPAWPAPKMKPPSTPTEKR